MSAPKKSQKEKFEEAARELGLDGSDETFVAAVTAVATAPKLSDDEIKELARKRREDARK